jgi:hypothetical protein
MVCNVLVAGGWWLVVGGQEQVLEQLSSSRTHSLLPCSCPKTTNNQTITHRMR